MTDYTLTPVDFDPFAAPTTAPAAPTASPQSSVGIRDVSDSLPKPAPASAPTSQTPLLVGSPTPQLPPDALESGIRGAQGGLTYGLGPTISGLNAASGIEPKVYSDPDVSKRPRGEDLSALGALWGAGKIAAQKVAPSIFGTGASDAYEQRRKEDLSRNQDAQDTNPGSFLGGELGGGVAQAAMSPMAVPFRAAQDAGIVGRAVAAGGNLAVNGAVQGGLGAGGTAISEEQSLPDAATNIAKGALTGTIAAPILGGVARGTGAVAGAGLENLGAWLKPAAFADKTIAEKLADAKISLSDLVDDMHAHHDAATAAGVTPAYTLADAANDALGNTAKNIADRQSRDGQAARDLFEQRQTDQRNRIDSHLGELFGHDGSLETVDRVKADQIARATPLYKAAYADPIDPLVTAHPDPDSPSLKDLTPSLQRAGVFGATQDAMAIDRTPFDLNTLQPWDYMKRELDYKIKRVNAGQENTGSADLPKLRRDLIAELDAQSPNYSLARDAWSGPAKEMESLENGANATKPGYTREQVQRDIAGATTGEKELYQLGHANALREQNANASAPGALPTAFKTNGASAQKLGMIIDDPARFSTFTKRMREESQISRTNQQNQGLPGKPPDAMSTSVPSAHMSHALRHGNVISLVYATARHISDPQLRGGFLKAARKIILSPNPDDARMFMERVDRVRAPKQQRDLLNRAVSKLVMNSVTNIAGQGEASSRQQHVTPPQPAPPVPPQQWLPARRAGSQGPATHLHNPKTGEMRLFDYGDVNE